MKELNLFQDEIEKISPEESPLFHDSIIPEDKEDDFERSHIEAHILTHLKRVIEAVLFASQDPISLPKIREITDTIAPLKPRQIRVILSELQQEYIAYQRAFRLEEIAQGYVLRTTEEFAPYIDLLYRQKRGEKLSYAATEVLAIVAYKQPITRPQIDAIRGVDSSGTINQLIERNLIEPVGKLDAPGRPSLYATTKDFLKHFGLKDISQLKPHLLTS